MTRREIQELRIHYGYPAITLIMTCDRQQVADTLMRLLHEADHSDDIESVKNQCLRAVDSLTCPLKTHKIALFVDKHGFYSFVVPADIPDTAICNRMFKLDALTASLTHQKRYWVIDCTQTEPMLSVGMGEIITPLNVLGRCLFISSPEKNPTGTQPTCFETQATRYFEQERLPICLIGPATCIDRFPKLSIFAQDIAARVQHMDEVWPAIQRWYAAETERVIKKISTGTAGRDYLTDFHAILFEARQGHIAQLVVEAFYKRPGCEHPVTRAVVLGTECPSGFTAISAIDQLIETVRAKGGTVSVIPPGTFIPPTHLAAFRLVV
jgi:hypothetical protein